MLLPLLQTAFSRTPLPPAVGANTATATPNGQVIESPEPPAENTPVATPPPSLLGRLGNILAMRPPPESDADGEPDMVGGLGDVVLELVADRELTQGFQEMQAVIPELTQADFNKIAAGIGSDAIRSGTVKWGEIAAVLSKAQTEQIEKATTDRKTQLSGAHSEGASRGTPAPQYRPPTSPAQGYASAKKFLGI